jgi:hypothetical protein
MAKLEIETYISDRELLQRTLKHENFLAMG